MCIELYIFGNMHCDEEVSEAQDLMCFIVTCQMTRDVLVPSSLIQGSTVFSLAFPICCNLAA